MSNSLYNLYHEFIPDYVQDIMKTSLFQRLKDVGMNCGMEYTQFEPFKDCRVYQDIIIV